MTLFQKNKTFFLKSHLKWRITYPALDAFAARKWREASAHV
jgi:hypothetical protein